MPTEKLTMPSSSDWEHPPLEGMPEHIGTLPFSGFSPELLRTTEADIIKEAVTRYTAGQLTIDDIDALMLDIFEEQAA